MKAIIYDFDGVILDSVNIKTLAFQELYSRHGKEVQNNVKRHHLLNGGISRFEKFKYYHKNYLNIDLSDLELESLAKKFSDIVFEKVCEANYIDGSFEFLKYSSSKYLTFICTGTPQKEIESILKVKGLDQFFSNVFGSPRSKESIIEEILLENNLDKKDVTYFGDAMTDYNACLQCGINFIGIENDDTQFPEKTMQITDFNDSRLLKLEL